VYLCLLLQMAHITETSISETFLDSIELSNIISCLQVIGCNLSNLNWKNLCASVQNCFAWSQAISAWYIQSLLMTTRRTYAQFLYMPSF
jgi:hypothetical protein